MLSSMISEYKSIKTRNGETKYGNQNEQEIEHELERWSTEKKIK